VWALIEGGMPVLAMRHVKIIWRVTGEGPLVLVAVNRAGGALTANEVAAHGGSNWRRPGDEWGTEWTFPTTGCWNVHVERGELSGDIWLHVS
jgi:hypothetical protein